MTLDDLRDLEDGRGDWFGEPWIVAARTYLAEMKEAWPFITSASQRQECEYGVRAMMEEISNRRDRKLGVGDWHQFCEECNMLLDDWRELIP